MIDISKFRNWEHCGYPEWFMVYEVTGAALVFLLYQFFAILAWKAMGHYIGQRVYPKKYWASLAVVFHFCGLLHFTKSMGLVYPELKVAGLLYPFLVVAMVSLLIQGAKAYILWNKTFKG